MTPDLILFGINSIIRLGVVSSKAAAQSARDADAFLPDLYQPSFEPISYINEYFSNVDTRDLVRGDAAPYGSFWDQVNDLVYEQHDIIETMLLLSIKIETQKGNSAADPRESNVAAAGSVMLAQWRKKDVPLNPWAGVIISAADIGLEYVSANPGILDLGTQGEKIIGAYAEELAELLPNDGVFGTQHGFSQRLAATFLKAGLNTVVENPDWLTDKKHFQELIKNSIAPLAESFPEQTLMTQLIWSDLGDAVMGPVAAAAFKTIAENQSAFLGEKFKPDKAIGAVTRAIFLKVADTGLSDQITKDGLVELSQAVFTVIAEKPALFIGNDESETDELANELVAGLANVLAQTTSFDRSLTKQLAGTAITTVGANAYRFQSPDKPWHKVATELTVSIAKTLSDVVAGNTQLEKVLTQKQLVELGRIVISNIGASPSLILSDSDAEWSGVLIAMANGMKSDKNLLLSGDDWLQIAALAAEEAARNPERLFNLNGGQVLAGQLISTIMEAAGEILTETDKARRSVLFGATLLEAVQISIRAASGNSDSVKRHIEVIKTLTTELNLFVAENHQKYGSKEWLCMFRLLLQSVLDGATLPELTEDIAENLLKGVV